MKDTPRTDAIRAEFRGHETELCRALIAHSNNLERELVETLEEIEHAQAQYDATVSALQDATQSAD